MNRARRAVCLVWTRHDPLRSLANMAFGRCPHACPSRTWTTECIWRTWSDWTALRNRLGNCFWSSVRIDSRRISSPDSPAAVRPHASGPCCWSGLETDSEWTPYSCIRCTLRRFDCESERLDLDVDIWASLGRWWSAGWRRSAFDPNDSCTRRTPPNTSSMRSIWRSRLADFEMPVN